MKRLVFALLPCLLGSCALLGTLPGPGSRGAPPTVQTATSASPLVAQAQATVKPGGLTVALTLLNTEGRRLSLRYAAQVNWGACGLPPYVALSREGGRAISAPSPTGRLTCPELQFTRTLGPAETLTLRRTLPSLPPGTYTLTAWFDGEVDGKPLRVQAPAVEVAAP